MVELSITYWNEITAYLNNYILLDAYIKDNKVFGINSNNEEFLLGIRSGIDFTTPSCIAFEVLTFIFREVRRDISKEYFKTMSERDFFIIKELKLIIQLYSKQYKSF